MSASSQRRIRFARRGPTATWIPHPELRVDGWQFLKQASVMAEMSEQLLIAEVERRLTDKHPHIRSDQVSFVIQTVCSQFEGSPIRDFVPLLVERRAGAELAKLKEAVPAPL